MRLSRLRWLIRQAVPTTYRSRYRDANGDHHFAVWMMWLGRVFRHDDVVYDPWRSVPVDG